MAKGGGNKKRFQYCTGPSGEILTLRALQGHSGRNLVDPSLQDNVLIPDGFFKYIYDIACAINLHSIINSGLIPGGQNLSKRQTVFFTYVDPLNKEHREFRITLTWKHCVLHGTSRKSGRTMKTRVLGRHKTCSTERILVLSNKIERNHPLRHTPRLLYPESRCDGIWRNHLRESICVTSTSSKNFH